MNFNQRVWNLCKKIPRGRITTYKLIAAKLKTKAYRAVGNALNKNPYAPSVPCHRVVRSNGKVGGFVRGRRKKIELLKKENIRIRNNRIVGFEKVLFIP